MLKKKRPITIHMSYMFALLVLIVALALAVFPAWFVFSARSERNQYADMLKRYDIQIASLSDRIDSLSTPAFTLFPATNPPLPNPAEPTSLIDALSIMQVQYSDFSSIMNFWLAAIGIAATLITIIIPIFNYTFVQKDQVDRINSQYEAHVEQSSKLEKQLSDLQETHTTQLGDLQNKYTTQLGDLQNEYATQLAALRAEIGGELDRLKKAVEQGTATNEAAAKGGIPPVIAAISNSAEDRAQALYVRALLSLRNDNYEHAIQETTAAINLDPGKASYYDLRSIALHALERYEDALKDCDKAIELDPQNAEYYNSRGVTLHALERYEDALKDCDKAIELDPQNARYYDSRSVTLCKLKRYEDALKDSTQAVLLDPSNGDYLASEGFAHLMLYNLSEAERCITQAITLDADNAFTYRVRAMYKTVARAADLVVYTDESILADYERALTLSPNNQYTMNYRSRFYLSINCPVEALADIKAAMALDHREPEIFHSYALYYEHIGDQEKADEYHKRANELGYIPDPK